MNVRSNRIEQERKLNPRLTAKMLRAKEGQAPHFLLISSINRAAQDLQLLGMEQGDAFHATRVTGFPLLKPSLSPLLFAAPVAFNSFFPKKHGAIIPFEMSEPEEIITQSLHSISLHPDLSDIPIIALRIDYESTSAEVIEHDLKRDEIVEHAILSNIQPCSNLNRNRLVLLCSDSRVQPPLDETGFPLSIQTLGAHIPEYTGILNESGQLDSFFRDWFATSDSSRQILIIEHGSFGAEGPSCGAGEASLDTSKVTGKYLRAAIEKIERDALQFEETVSRNAEDRVLALARATEKNLRTYPAVISASTRGENLEELILIIAMDTVTGKIMEIG